MGNFLFFRYFLRRFRTTFLIVSAVPWLKLTDIPPGKENSGGTPRGIIFIGAQQQR